MTDRRRFLKASAALWAAGTLGAANRPLRAAGCGRGNDGLCNSKYLLLDHRVVQQTEGVMLVLGKVRKHPGPLFREEKPWEVRYDNLYANVIFDDQQQIFKCWYSPFTIDTATSNTRESQRPNVTYRQALSKHRRREMGVCYATSRDGTVWEKPDLEIIEFDGSKSNNLVMRGVHGAGVWKDLRDQAPARRYKMLLENRPMSVAFSPDGLHWSKLVPCPTIDAAGDTHNNSFWDDGLGLYVGITRLWRDGHRVVGRTESPDFVNWTKAVEVLRGLEPHLQTYAMPVFRYANVYLGLVMVFDTQADLVHCELAWSPNSVYWERVCPGTPLIPRGPKGSHDWGCVYGAAYPILHRGELLLYYGGSDGPHTAWRKGSLCLARLRPDGFAGMRPKAEDQPGTVTTRPVICSGKYLRLSADAKGGAVGVAVLDPNGHRLDEGKPITGDVTDEPVKWESDAGLAAYVGKRIQLKFQLNQATLYAFGFVQ